MSKPFLMPLAFCALMGPLSGTALSQEAFVGVSSLGPMVGGSNWVTDSVTLRGFYTGGLSFDDTEISNGETEVTTIRVGGLALLADYHMGQGPFRVSGGLFFSTTSVDRQLSGDVNLAGVVRNTEVSADAAFTYPVAPMLTVGYDARNAQGWSVGGEVGFILNGGFDATLTQLGTAFSDAELAAGAREIEDDLGLTVLPFLGLSIEYKF